MIPGPDLSDDDVEELLGAYALDACEPDEIEIDLLVSLAANCNVPIVVR